MKTPERTTVQNNERKIFVTKQNQLSIECKKS